MNPIATDRLANALRPVIRDEVRSALREVAYPTRLLTLGQVADVLGVSVRTVRRRIARRELAAIPVGRGKRVHPAALDDYIRAQASFS